MAYQSEVSRMLLLVKPSPGGVGGGGAAAGGLSHSRAGSSCGSRVSSSSLLYSRVAAAAARGGAAAAGADHLAGGGSSAGGRGGGSDVGSSSSVLSGSGSSLLRASSKLRAAAAANNGGRGGFFGSGSSAAAAGAGGAVPGAGGAGAAGGAPGGGAAGVGGGVAGGAAAGAAAAGVQQQQQVVVHFRGQQTSLGFLISKILELLKLHAGRTLHVKEVEKALIHAGFSSLHLFFQANSDFLKLLSSNERVAYNPVSRTLAFHNPYQAITSCNALLARIRYDGALTGLRVEQELLSANVEMESWIHSLLAARRVRAVRGNNNHLRGKKKCLCLSAGASQANAAAACDIYAARKCSNCRQNLVGLLLYPLADDVYEDARMTLDAEVKGLWDSIELPPLEEIVRECHPRRGLARLGGGLEANDRTRHKRQPDTKRASRFRSKFRRIQNTHLFTAEELRAISDQHNS